MNIKQAKEQIKNAMTAYFTKDEFGAYAIPIEKQRPIFLMGPPGIGKTAIMEQVAQELGVALVSYSMTHHTRQSALGLPYIEHKTYGGKEYAVSEYTMSEIIASVYDMMEQTGLKEGILFLDEINCVSETLAPSMLQFLQYKIFGRHRVPDGWIVVTAGNPPEYNNSVREFDIVTWDRLKRVDVEPDFDAWKEYAYLSGVHPAVTTYLDVKKPDFYTIETTVDGKHFVTARGWEDLSFMLLSLEGAGETVTDEFFLQYLQHDDIARSFAAYYSLFRSFLGGEDGEETPLAERLAENSERLAECTAAECLAIAAILFHGIRSGAQERSDALLRLGRLEELTRLIPSGCDFAREENRSGFFASRRRAAQTMQSLGQLKPEEELLKKGTDARVNPPLRTEADRQAIIESYAAYLKIAPNSMAVEVRTLPADTSDYVERMRQYAAAESNEYCREMIEDNIREIGEGVASEAIRHRFFIIFQYEAQMKAKRNTVKGIVERLNDEADTARRYLDICELEVLEPRYMDNFVLKLLYEIINKKTAQRVKLPEGVFDMTTAVHGIYEQG